MQANVKTLSVRLGVKRVFWACIVLLELAYAGAIGLGVLSQVRQAIKIHADHAAHHQFSTFLSASYLDPAFGCISSRDVALFMDLRIHGTFMRLICSACAGNI